MDPGPHSRRVSHTGKVGADIDSVGGKQRDRAGKEQPWRKFLSQCAGKATTSNHPDPRAHKLHATHQGPGDERRPKQGGAELRTRD